MKVLKDKKAIKEEINLHKLKLYRNEQKESKDTSLNVNESNKSTLRYKMKDESNKD